MKFYRGNVTRRLDQPPFSGLTLILIGLGIGCIIWWLIDLCFAWMR